MSLNPFPAIRRGALALLRWIHSAFCALMSEAGLKAWALIMAWGCSMAMTGLAIFAFWWTRKSPMLIFWLGTEAMAIILVVITGIMVLLGVRRNLRAKHGDSELEIDDAALSSPPAPPLAPPPPAPPIQPPTLV